MEWERVRPVLRESYTALREAQRVRGEDIAARLPEMEEDEVGLAFQRLFDAGYLSGQGAWQAHIPIFVEATEKGLQETSGWPSLGGTGAEQFDVLLAALTERIEAPDTPEDEKGRLRQIRDGVTAAGRDITVGDLTAYAKTLTGAS